jgi:hypothetical protein
MVKIKIRQQALTLTVILGIVLICLSSLSFVSADSYNNVQIFIQTNSGIPDYFTISAFNMSGFMVASSQTFYPAASFELPNGQYMFIVTAEQRYYSTDYKSTPVTAKDSTGIATPTISPDLPVTEYGYSVVQVTSSKTFTIQTVNSTSLRTHNLTIKVAYANGTAAKGASVYGSILGGYYWGYENKLMMSNVTDAEGISNLIVPDAPVQVYAWSWLPVNLPEDKPSVQVAIVGGEKVNVTVYWQPNYVGLAGSVLLVPPEISASISLHVQQSSYWATSSEVRDSTGMKDGTTTATSGPGLVPAAINQQSQTSSVTPPSTVTAYVTSSDREPTLTTTSSISESSNSIPVGSALLFAIAAVLIGVTGAFTIVVTTRKK